MEQTLSEHMTVRELVLAGTKNTILYIFRIAKTEHHVEVAGVLIALKIRTLIPLPPNLEQVAVKVLHKLLYVLCYPY